MPSKIQNDVNLWFLYICLQKSDYKTIDFNAVAAAANINPPAARMRFTRLKKAIESGTLDSLEGTNPPTPVYASGKCSTIKSKINANIDRKDSLQQKPVSGNCKQEMSQEKTPNIIMTEAPHNSAGPAWVHHVCPDEAIKRESPSFTDGDTEMEDDDDVPLATKRKIALASSGMNKARKRRHDGPRGIGGSASNPQFGNSVVGATPLPPQGTVIAAPINRAVAPARGMVGADVAPDRAQEELQSHNHHSAAIHNNPQILPNQQKGVHYPTSTSGTRSLGLWEIASARAEMVNSQMSDSAAGEDATGGAGVNRPSQSGFTRYSGLSGPNNGTWRGYRIPTITVTDIDANANADANTDARARANNLTYENDHAGRPF